MRRLATLAVLVVVAALALVSAGCGGDGDEASSTAEWAETFCAAVTDWNEEIGRVADGLTSSLTQEGLQQAADDMAAATDEFVDTLQELGAPDTEGGEEVEEAIQELADTAEAEKAEAQEAVEGIEDATDIGPALGVIGTSLQAVSTALQAMFTALEDADVSGELNTAFEESPACEQIGD